MNNRRIITTEEAEAYLKEGVQNEEELRAIFERTYGAVKRERQGWERVSKRNPNRNPSVRSSETENTRKEKKREPIKEYLLVDGYNIIFAWEDLNELSKINIESARNKLMDRLSNYQGYKKMTLILVFDAYKVKGNPGSVMKYHNIYVVYTKEAKPCPTKAGTCQPEKGISELELELCEILCIQD